MGMRSRAPPVADAARRSTRSGRKNRASEQREDFFGHRKAARAVTLTAKTEDALIGKKSFTIENGILKADTLRFATTAGKNIWFEYSYLRKINHFLKKIYCQIPQKVVKLLLE